MEREDPNLNKQETERKENTASMLLFLSQYNPKSVEKTYRYKRMTKSIAIQGVQTNDAPTKYLLKIAKEEDQRRINKIFCIVSKEVYYEVIDSSEQKTAFEIFSKMIKTYAQEELGYFDLEVLPIAYDFHLSAEHPIDPFDSKKSAVYIYEQIETNLKKFENGQEIYIDYTGGFRDINFLMTIIIRYLEFKGISCKKIVYSHFQKEEIMDIRYIYDMFEIINGMSEFIDSGNARKLMEFNKRVFDEKRSENNAVRDLIEHIQNFSDAMSICSIKEIDTALAGIIEGLTALENDESGDIFIQMLRTLLPTIKHKMYVKDGKISDLDLIYWCLQNNMLQQAATIYVEKILMYYHDFCMEFREILHNSKNQDEEDCSCKEKTLKELKGNFNRNVCVCEKNSKNLFRVFVVE